MMSTTDRIAVNIRWMIRRDMPEIYEIENLCFEFPWDEDTFIRWLRQRNCIGMVAEHDERIVGHLVYELHRSRLHIQNFAVLPSQQRKGIGTAMVNKLKSKLSTQRRNRIVLETRENNLDSHLFWKAMGFKAIGISHEWYDNDEDAYVFQYRHGG